MKPTVLICLSAVMLVALASTVGAAQSDSLGDYARSVRKEKKNGPAKQFDNDNLPKTEKLSVVGQEPPAEAKDADGKAKSDGDAAAKDAKGDGSAAAGDQKPKDAAAQKTAEDDKQKAWDSWQKKLAEQKDKIAMLSRELDVMQREYKLRAAAMYADAGNRLRNAADWDKEDTQYKQQIADKQKSVDAAKQQLDDMQEEARRAGVPSSKRE